MKLKYIFFIIISFFSFSLFAKPKITNLNNYLKENSYNIITSIPLQKYEIQIWASDLDKSGSGKSTMYYGDVFIVSFDPLDKKVNSFEIVQFNSTSILYCTDGNEFIIIPKGRSEIKGSREILLYDSKYNIFKVFISRYMFLNDFAIFENNIICKIGNNNRYKYLLINKGTGEEKPVNELDKDILLQYEKLFSSHTKVLQFN